VEPDEFLTRDEFENLSDDEQGAYYDEVSQELRTASGTEIDRQLAIAEHWCEILEWTLEPEEYERLIRRPLWNERWERAEQLATVYRKALASGELTAEEQQTAEAGLRETEDLIAHKRDLENLP
jgi:hypothetical protein